MFLCISANPAIDKRLRVAQLEPGTVNRATEAVPEAGGKATHVAMALKALGARPLWIGFAGGASGESLLAGLRKLGISALSVPVAQPTRENLSIVDDLGSVTEILEPGPVLSGKELNQFKRLCAKEFARAKSNATVVLSGSLPPGVPNDFYAELIQSAHDRSCCVALDTSGDALRLGMQAKPDLVKPNREEAERLTGKEVRDAASARRALMEMLSLGAKSAAVSLGEDGLLWCPGKGEPVLHARPQPVKECSAVGSGDSAVAGFVWGMQRELTPEGIARRAAACGAANCFTDSPARIRLSDVRKIEKAVRVEILPE